MTEREWITLPRDIEVGTQYGPVYISCHGHENDPVYVDAQSNGKALTFAGKQYPMRFHLERREGTWTLVSADWAISGCAPRSYKMKMAAEVIRAVGTYLGLHPHLVVDAARARTNNALVSLEDEIAKLEAALAEKRAKVTALVSKLAQIDKQSPPARSSAIPESVEPGTPVHAST